MKPFQQSLFIFFIFFPVLYLHAVKITIVGCGYVGLTMGALLSRVESNITCYDIDKKKIESLKNKMIPIYEPGLQDLLFYSNKSPQIIFTHDASCAMNADLYLICVPTPSKGTGHCDTTYLFNAFDAILKHTPIEKKKIICVKSTVSPGTMDLLQERLKNSGHSAVYLAYNPEFMREGSALTDVEFRNPVVMAGDYEALEVLDNLYKRMLSKNKNAHFIKTNFASAEMIKYAWNSFSAIRIAYVNELALLSRKLGADISVIVKALALSEELLPTHCLKPGPGYGGSCLPKDTNGFSRIIEHEGFDNSMIHQAIISNEKHIQQLEKDVFELLGQSLAGKTITLLGLSFKANTNDIRNAPSLKLIRTFLAEGMHVKVYDPKAGDEVTNVFPDVIYCSCPYKAVSGADCVIVLTEWDEIIQIDLAKVAQIVRSKIIIDARNLYDPKIFKELGFKYLNMGRI